MDKAHFPILINLLRGVNKVMDADLHESAKSVDLTLTELNFLWTIFYEGEPTVSRMAELTLLDSSTVTQVLNRLKNKKLISSYKKKEDTRFSYVKLTDKGNEKRKLSMNNRNALFDFLQKEMEIPGEKEKIQITLDYLKKINLYFHGENFVNWAYSLPIKLNEDFIKNQNQTKS
ncbi:winged helix-turn-helix transcriptional regulator [Bacillus sp. V3B]|uniref:MarR family winged helix-turn-helix transcriptional regulator n=1 Tax=Bacillus sp. V3B TaxID=2804915 RepID=UPI00210974CD|nr:MarR family winged helix-turn-helix transcriptional regulator [Bacillus sp. V3B]MCQ6277494.1 winged helix-turn-helix transcriptional regulator [Bacillus sp. V3B]